jgi:hypothetical protein
MSVLSLSSVTLPPVTTPPLRLRRSVAVPAALSLVWANMATGLISMSSASFGPGKKRTMGWAEEKHFFRFLKKYK